MATQIKRRRDTRANIDAATPAVGEVGVNTDSHGLRVGDGATAGGIILGDLDHVRKTATYTAVKADKWKVLEFDSGSAVTLNLTAAATLKKGWFCGVYNSGAGALTIDPASAELINDASTIELAQGESCIIVCDGAAFWTIGLAGGSPVEVIATSTPSAVSSVTLTGITGDHDVVELVILNWRPATDDKELHITVTVATVEQTGAEYAYNANNLSFGAAAGGWPSASQNNSAGTAPYWPLTERGVGNAAGERCTVRLRLDLPASTSFAKSGQAFGYFNDNGGNRIGIIANVEFVTAADAVDGFVIRAESGGNFSADLIALVGHKL